MKLVTSKATVQKVVCKKTRQGRSTMNGGSITNSSRKVTAM